MQPNNILARKVLVDLIGSEIHRKRMWKASKKNTNWQI